MGSMGLTPAVIMGIYLGVSWFSPRYSWMISFTFEWLSQIFQNPLNLFSCSVQPYLLDWCTSTGLDNNNIVLYYSRGFHIHVAFQIHILTANSNLMHITFKMVPMLNVQTSCWYEWWTNHKRIQDLTISIHYSLLLFLFAFTGIFSWVASVIVFLGHPVTTKRLCKK